MNFWKSISSNKSQFNPIDKKVVNKYNKTRQPKSRKYLCYAPFRSLTFFIAGDIMACWNNKQFLLGHYPENSIHDVWFGKKAEKLRNHIIQNDLTCGCNDCLLIINNGDFHITHARKYDYLAKWSSTYPVIMDFQISNICNLECIMCNGEFSVSVRQHCEMEKPYINPYDSNFVKQLEPFIPHLKEATFSGGEVFFIDQYFQLWEKIYQINPNIMISVTSNGTIMNERIKAILEKLRFSITLSIDSVNKLTYEKIRKNACFEDTISNFHYYLEYTKRKNTFFTVRICPMRQNWKEIPEIISFLNDKDVSFFFNTVLLPANCSLWNLKSEKIMEIIEYLSGFTFKSNTNTQKQNIRNYLNLIDQLKNWHNEAKTKENDYPLMNTYNTNKLIELLNLKVKKYLITTNSFDPDEKENFLLFFEKTIELCKKEIIDQEQFNRALRHYLGFPVNRLIDEFNIRNEEKIINFTKQAGRVID